MVKCFPLFDANLASPLDISGGCYPLKIAKNRHLWRHNSRWRHFWSFKMLLLCCWQNFLWDRYGLYIIYVFKVFKMSEISDNQWKIAKNHHFGTIDDVISPDDNISRFWKCYHCVPGHISYRIRYMICVKKWHYLGLN